MAIETIKKQREKQKKAVEVLVGKKNYLSPIKPLVSSPGTVSVLVPGYTASAKVVHQGSYANPFVVPDFFLKQAEDMGKFLDKNPIPERD